MKRRLNTDPRDRANTAKSAKDTFLRALCSSRVPILSVFNLCFICGLITFLLSSGGSVSLAAASVESHALFEAKIRPLFIEHCQKCHGEKKQEGGLRLDTKAGWQKGGEHGSVIVPGDPDKSRLIQAVRRQDKSLQMPPKRALGSEEIAAAWGPWMLTCIELFGAGRCMFESNFPVQKRWSSFAITWNGFKRIAAGASADEKRDLFAGTARRIYGVP